MLLVPGRGVREGWCGFRGKGTRVEGAVLVTWLESTVDDVRGIDVVLAADEEVMGAWSLSRVVRRNREGR